MNRTVVLFVRGRFCASESTGSQRAAAARRARVACYRRRHNRKGNALSYDIDLSGRVALVTGASSGLGAQFARALAKAGAGVALAARRIERLKTLRAEIESEGGDAPVIELDVTDPDSIKAAVAHTETEMGTIDILVNNSGVSRAQKLVEVQPEDYDFIMDTNARGAFFVAQEVGKRMIGSERVAKENVRGESPSTMPLMKLMVISRKPTP
jgi:hypothetical protein